MRTENEEPNESCCLQVECAMQGRRACIPVHYLKALKVFDGQEDLRSVEQSVIFGHSRPLAHVRPHLASDCVLNARTTVNVS
jgi:hypothetical protein